MSEFLNSNEFRYGRSFVSCLLVFCVWVALSSEPAWSQDGESSAIPTTNSEWGDSFDLPEWTSHDSLHVDQVEHRVLKTAPCLTIGEAEKALDDLMTAAVREYAQLRIASEAGVYLHVPAKVIRENWLAEHLQAPYEFNFRENGEAATRTMYRCFAQIRLSPDLDDFLATAWDDQKAVLKVHQQQQVLWRGSIIAVAIFLLLGLFHSGLRLDYWTRSNYSRRLFTFVFGLGLAVVALAIYLLRHLG